MFLISSCNSSHTMYMSFVYIYVLPLLQRKERWHLYRSQQCKDVSIKIEGNVNMGDSKEKEQPQDAKKDSHMHACHPHPLMSNMRGTGGWACDGRLFFGGCRGGITDFYQTSAKTPRYRCPKCDFDLCGDCFADKSLRPSTNPPETRMGFERFMHSLKSGDSMEPRLAPKGAVDDSMIDFDWVLASACKGLCPTKESLKSTEVTKHAPAISARTPKSSHSRRNTFVAWQPYEENNFNSHCHHRTFRRNFAYRHSQSKLPFILAQSHELIDIKTHEHAFS